MHYLIPTSHVNLESLMLTESKVVYSVLYHTFQVYIGLLIQQTNCHAFEKCHILKQTVQLWLYYILHYPREV